MQIPAKYTINIYILSISCLLSCSTNDHIKHKNIQTIDLSKRIRTTDINLSDIVDTIVYQPLETGDSSLFSQISKFIFYKDHYYILDAFRLKKVLVFDAEGKFITLVGRKGEGPGEYSNPVDIAIDSILNSLFILE